MKNILAGLLALTWLGLAVASNAHEIRPAYLQIEETATHSYGLLWKVPRRGMSAVDIQPRFADGFELKGGRETLLDGYVVYHYRLSGQGGLPGTTLSIRNLTQTTIDVLVNLRTLNGEQQTFLLRPSANQIAIPRAPGKWQIVNTYTALGMEHIWLGIDHLLFVLALIMLTRGFASIVKTITAFTLAHSITLGLATLGYVRVPAPPVEAIIALSILYLALEILRGINGQKTLTGQMPWLVAFTFGLLHGFGFAGALTEIGLPQADIPLALAAFNIGVELGQLVFVGAVLLLIYILRYKTHWPISARKIPPYTIGAVSAFWVIERVAAFAT
ncbi:HupE/UreJ family protein [Microbulbifer bruguierae]|uniref:HupE/UreJ family protein n=1 Tax=Microbulbifer bruguierae TaxID=3029061 RepID=A0ABY8N8H1_9GAMM|nr:HupE/UreJ family protein [Microbulbifer bruguierae]WGL15195.1 HupE/UreJ family protein [Microbulbifer bruguierae]